MSLIEPKQNYLVLGAAMIVINYSSFLTIALFETILFKSQRIKNARISPVEARCKPRRVARRNSCRLAPPSAVTPKTAIPVVARETAKRDAYRVDCECATRQRRRYSPSECGVRRCARVCSDRSSRTHPSSLWEC